MSKNVLVAGVFALATLLSTTMAQAAEPKVGPSGCFEGRMTCEAWCKKYRERANQASCQRTHDQSCMKKYGSLKVCVNDRPPA